jgi:hypothetical protein
LICAAPGAKYRIIFCQDMRLTKNSSQASNVRPLRGRALQTPAFFIGFHAPQAHENEQSALALLVLGFSPIPTTLPLGLMILHFSPMA